MAPELENGNFQPSSGAGKGADADERPAGGQDNGNVSTSSMVGEWETELLKQAGWEATSDVRAYLQALHAERVMHVKWDHVTMRLALEAAGLLRRTRYIMSPMSGKALYAIWQFGPGMVGHPSITHGGATAFAFDETFGVLFAKHIGAPGFTANLNLDYRKPFPASQPAILHAEVDTVEGRKVYMKGTLKGGLDGPLFAEAKVLFIIAKGQ